MSDALNILDSTLDDLADFPEVKPYPAGTYVVNFSLSTKEINKKPAVEAKLVLVEVAELASPTDTAPVAGDETTLLMILINNDGAANEYSQGQLKNILAKLKEAGVPGDSPREMIAATKDGIPAAVTLGVRTKNDRTNNTLSKIEFSV
jgi:hypothetical protein